MTYAPELFLAALSLACVAASVALYRDAARRDAEREARDAELEAATAYWSALRLNAETDGQDSEYTV